MSPEGITLKVTLVPDALLGPGKADLLQGIREARSVVAAGHRMGMSYKRAWYPINGLNGVFGEPLAGASEVGKTGKGARLA